MWYRATFISFVTAVAGLLASAIAPQPVGRLLFYFTGCACTLLFQLLLDNENRKRWRLEYYWIVVVMVPIVVGIILSSAACLVLLCGPENPYAFVVVPCAGAWSVLISVPCSLAYALIRGPRPKSWQEFQHCEQCGYRIDNLPEPRCPECGRSFQIDDKSTP